MRARPIYLLFAACLGPCAAEPDQVFAGAWQKFEPNVPAGFAYTVTTTRGGDVAVERFDPSRPRHGQWILLRRNGAEPSATEREQYLRYKTTNAAAHTPTYSKGDVDLASVAPLRKEDGYDVYLARFRADVQAPLLAHLVLELYVPTGDGVIARARLRSFAPFSPAIGVRLSELEVTTEYGPAADGLRVPVIVRSQVRGRVFFVFPLHEEVQTRYADYTRVAGKAAGSPSGTGAR